MLLWETEAGSIGEGYIALSSFFYQNSHFKGKGDLFTEIYKLFPDKRGKKRGE
jgi:hypothetical protein